MEKRVLEEPIYGYHPLFREFLLSQAEKTFSEQNLSFFRGQAAEILEEHGQVESAVRLLQKIGDWETLIQLILKHAPVLHAQGRYSVLEGWLQSLPPGLVEARPWLAYWMGACRIFADPAQSRPYFEQAYRQMRKEKDAAGLFMAWSGMMDDINLGYGFVPYSVLDRHLQELEEIRRDFPGFPSAEIEARVASAVVAALALRQPNHPEFEAWAERALRLAQDQTVVNMRIQSLFFLAYYHLYGGNREKALLAINQLRQMSQSPQASAYTKLMTNMAEAMHYCIVGLSRESMKAAQTGSELSQRSGVLFAYHGFLAFAGFAAFQMNDLQAGRCFLKQMTSCERNLKPLDTTYYYLLKANEALVSGEVRQGFFHADLALKMALDVGSPPLTIRCHLVKARALAEAGSRAEAKKHLKQAADLSRQMKIGFGEFCCLFTQAQFDFDWGEEKTAWMTLRKALILGKERGLMGIYVDRPTSTARVCMKALEAGIEVDYIQEMIRERNLMPEQPPWHLENWPWPLKIFTLGRFAILKDGKLIRFTRKVQQKPLAMLKALIALGGKEVEEEQISDILWPDADGDMAHQAWATTLHRLRQLLGEEKVLQRQEGRLTLDTTYCWVDAWAFEHILEQAEVRWKEGQKDEAVKLTEKAIELYKGPFLGQKIEELWAMSPSERLRGKFFRGVKRIGLFCQERGEWDKAIECLQKGLEVDNLAEEFYQGLMTCYQRLSRRSEALLVYSRCKKVLATALGVGPSPKTESIHQEILSAIQ
jgi:DNA-binding SARP family transcriptional activator